MRAREFILEYRRDITAQKSGERLLARNKLADMTKITDVEQLLAELETADFTTNRNYMLWIVNRYIAGDFFLEDTEVVREYLGKFAKAKHLRLIDPPDINRYSLGQLKAAIDKIYPTDKEDRGMGSALYPVIPGTQVLYNGPQGQFAIMSTLEGSMQHNRQVGKFARWCTADSRAPRHYASHAQKGPLYVYVDPQGFKYQMHFESNQFKDITDTEIAKSKAKEIVSLPFVWKNIDWPRAMTGRLNMALSLLPPEMVSDPALVKMIYAVVEKKGEALQFVPDELITPELCQLAVQQDFRALEFVPQTSMTSKQYLEICLAAVQQNSEALQFVPDELRTPELCLIAVQQNGLALRYVPTVPKQLRTFELCLIAVQQNKEALQFVPHKSMTSKQYFKICLAVIQQNGLALSLVPEQLRTPELCRIAVQKHGQALIYVPIELRTPEICLAAVQNRGRALGSVPEQLRTFELCSIAVQQNGLTLTYVPQKSMTSKQYLELCLIAVRQNGLALRYVPRKLKRQVESMVGL